MSRNIYIARFHSHTAIHSLLGLNMPKKKKLMSEELLQHN